MDNIFSKISNNYREMTPGQRKLAEYIDDLGNEVFLLNSRQLAKQAGVSEATVSRFVKELGFESFSEFRDTMGRTALENFSTTKRLADSSEQMRDQEEILTHILDCDRRNIGEMKQSVSASQVSQAVEHLCNARHIYVLGLRSSYALAFYLAFYLKFFLSNVTLIEPGIGDLPEQLLEAGKKDALITLSFKRYTRETVELTEKIKKRGLDTIAITDSALSPVAETADNKLITPTRIPTFFESYTAPMSLINVLLTAIAIRQEDRSMEALNKMESVFREFKTYY